ncbi:MAG: hypothetical protein ACI81Q_000688 [Paracoccaceae bacterium]|jgi:hypothetical protein
MVPRYGTILDGCRPFDDRYSILNLAISLALLAGVFGTPNSPSCAQMLQEFLFKDASRLYIKASVDRSPLGTLLRNTLPVSACDTCLCASRGKARLSQPATCSGDHLRRSFADTAQANLGWQANLHILGRKARSYAA